MHGNDPASEPSSPHPETTDPSWDRRSELRARWEALGTAEIFETLRHDVGIDTDAEEFLAFAQAWAEPHAVAHQWLEAVSVDAESSPPDDAARPGERRSPCHEARPAGESSDELVELEAVDDDVHDLLWEAAVVLWDRLLPDAICPETTGLRMLALIARDRRRAERRVRTPESAFLRAALAEIDALLDASAGPRGVPGSEFFDLVEEYLDDAAPPVLEWLLDFPARLFASGLVEEASAASRDLAMCLDAPDLLVDRVRMMGRIGRSDLAEKAAEDIPCIFPDGFGLLRMGIAYQSLGDLDEAERLFRRVFDDDRCPARERREARELLAHLDRRRKKQRAAKTGTPIRRSRRGGPPEGGRGRRRRRSS